MINDFIRLYGATVMAWDCDVSNMDEFLAVSSYANDHFDSGGGALKFKVTNKGKRSLSQNAFQHVVYTEISKYLVGKGRTDWTPDYTKRNLKNKFLGWQDEEYIDVVTGEKTVESVLRKTSELDPGDSFHFTTAILDWSESIGCFIKIPDCEYRELQEAQNG